MLDVVLIVIIMKVYTFSLKNNSRFFIDFISTAEVN